MNRLAAVFRHQAQLDGWIEVAAHVLPHGFVVGGRPARYGQTRCRRAHSRAGPTARRRIRPGQRVPTARTWRTRRPAGNRLRSAGRRRSPRARRSGRAGRRPDRRAATAPSADRGPRPRMPDQGTGRRPGRRHIASSINRACGPPRHSVVRRLREHPLHPRPRRRRIAHQIRSAHRDLGGGVDRQRPLLAVQLDSWARSSRRGALPRLQFAGRRTHAQRQQRSGGDGGTDARMVDDERSYWRANSPIGCASNSANGCGPSGPRRLAVHGRTLPAAGGPRVGPGHAARASSQGTWLRTSSHCRPRRSSSICSSVRPSSVSSSAVCCPTVGAGR